MQSLYFIRSQLSNLLMEGKAMKGVIWIDDPKQDRELLEPLIQRFRELINKHDLCPCVVKIEDGAITVAPGLSLERKREQKTVPISGGRKKKKVA